MPIAPAPSPAPRLMLAPMEGLADDVLRDVLTQAGGYDYCVTEFIRVSTTRLPHTAFLRVSPELRHGARTRAGTPVRLQLLGSDPELLATNAAHAAELAPAGIDLNFGCPTPLVNRKRAGAALLDDPQLLHRIAAAVRRAVPPEIPVSAKMRLGIRDTAGALDCALALAAAGIQELVVHARTRDDGYRPPARWEELGALREAIAIPLVANGEVWSIADYHAIRRISGCTDVMLGRGAVADPFLASSIRAGSPPAPGSAWLPVAAMIEDFWRQVQAKVLPRQAPGRLKQWLGLLRHRYAEAGELFDTLRPHNDAAALSPVLAAYLKGLR